MYVMSFKDIINQQRKEVEENQGGGNAKVEYPKTKHKRLYFQKGVTELLIQILPSSDLVSSFSVPIRTIFLDTMSSQGKKINSNFVLSADTDHGSLLENKIKEWSEKGMIPNGFGGQASPRRTYLTNVVQIVKDANGNFVQERDEQGNLVVRAFEIPQSGYANLLTKLQDPMYNASGTDFSFMDVNKPNPIKISKPAKGQMEYPVDVYVNVQLPPLGQGWENQLEDLEALAVPTERLENGAQWVQAFVDMKEGRKPNQKQNQNQNNEPSPDHAQTNPYLQQQQQQTQQAPPTGMQQGHSQGQPMGMPQGGQGSVAPQTQVPNPPQDQGMVQGQGQAPQQPQTQTQMQMPNQNAMDGNAEEKDLNDYYQGQGQAPQQPDMSQPTAPNPNPNPTQGQQTQPQQQAPTEPTPTQGGTNSNGLPDIDAMLERELGGGQ